MPCILKGFSGCDVDMRLQGNKGGHRNDSEESKFPDESAVVMPVGRWWISGHILKAESIGFPSGLDTRYKRERSRVTAKFLA